MKIDWQSWYKFFDKVLESNTYKHSYYVYADTFNEGESGGESLLGSNLTENEAIAIYNANKHAVETCGADYAEIWIENAVTNPFALERLTGKVLARSRQFLEIAKNMIGDFSFSLGYQEDENGRLIALY